MPDLVTTAKGIAGGLPLAGVTGRAEIMDAVHAGGLGGTYGGNPIACAAALAAIETMRELTWPPPPGASSAVMLPAAAQRSPPRTRDRRRPRPGRHARRSSWSSPARADARAARPRTRRRPRRSPKACHEAGLLRADLRHLRQRDPLPAAAGHRTTRR